MMNLRQVSSSLGLVFSASTASLVDPSSVDARLPVTATADEVEALQVVARSVTGDDWQALAQCLRLRAAAVHSARRRAELLGFGDRQARLEVLSSWFRAQPRSTDKVFVYAVKTICTVIGLFP